MSSPFPPPTDHDLSLREGGTPLAPDTAFVTALTRGCANLSQAHLVQIHPRDSALGNRYVVGHLPVVIGREAECTVPCQDQSVSRTHARVERRPDGRYQVSDLGSRNGTFVNNSPARVQILGDGDNLQVGSTVFRFLAPGNVEASYHEEINRLAALDPLTGLHNRRALADCLAREVTAATRHRRPLSVAMFDIDHFKAVNDRLGHAAGDLAIKALVATVAALARKEDLLARYGGEEFVLVLPDVGPEQAHKCGERARAAVAAQPFAFEGRSYSITVSVGVAGFRGGEWLLPSELVRRADEQLYQAKHGGRNRVCSARPAATESCAHSLDALESSRPGGTVALMPDPSDVRG